MLYILTHYYLIKKKNNYPNITLLTIMTDTGFRLNKQTGRYVKFGSRTYVRGLKAGDIDPEPVKEHTVTFEEPVIEPLEAPPPSPESITRQDNVQIQQFDNTDMKDKLRSTMMELVEEQKAQFVGLSQKQNEALLRKMLYEKLCVTDKKVKKSKKTTSKKKKKSKFKLVEPSSSDEDSSSESESE